MTQTTLARRPTWNVVAVGCGAALAVNLLLYAAGTAAGSAFTYTQQARPRPSMPSRSPPSPSPL